MAEERGLSAGAVGHRVGRVGLGSLIKPCHPSCPPPPMENRKRLAYSIIQYLHDQLQHGGLPPEARESLEASIQCLETAFEVAVEDEGLAVAQTLPEMFRTFTGAEAVPPPPPIPHCGRAVPEAERLKAAGNEQMKRDNFEAAVSFYGRAIALNPANAVYFCNRAAAYSSLGNHAGAVEDCRRAVAIDPYYGKAYGRMGLALAGLKRHREAAACYRKALTLDPDNATYRASLAVAERRMQEIPPGGASVGCNLAGLLNHSSFRSVASSLLNNPQIRQIMSGVMAGGHPAPGAGRAGSAPSGGPGFVRRGRPMQPQNPELGEQLRSQARSWTPSAGKHKQE